MAIIKPISIAETEHIGVDEEGRLYWKGKPIVTEQRISLQWWVNVGIIVGSLSTLCIAIAEIVRLLFYDI